LTTLWKYILSIFDNEEKTKWEYDKPPQKLKRKKNPKLNSYKIKCKMIELKNIYKKTEKTTQVHPNLLAKYVILPWDPDNLLKKIE